MADQNLPQDAFYSVGKLVFHLTWHSFVLGLLIWLVTVLVCSREYLADVAHTDRVIQKIDAFPASYIPWGFSASSHPDVPPRWSIQQSKVNSDKDDLVLHGFRENTKWLQPIMEKIGVYNGGLILPRMVVLLGFLPGLVAMMWMAWGLGMQRNAVRAKAGKPLSAYAYKNYKTGLSLANGLFFSFPFWPVPLSSWLLLLPMSAMLIMVVFVRQYRA
jgi:hypothetical protein